MSNYYQKYLKYKNKYLELKNLMGGQVSDVQSISYLGGGQVPDGWQVAVDPSSGKSYYYNSATNQTSWNIPSEAPSRSAAPSVAASSRSAEASVASPSRSVAPSVASPSRSVAPSVAASSRSAAAPIAATSRSAAASVASTRSAEVSRSDAPSLPPIKIPIVSTSSESNPSTPTGSPKVSLPPPNVLPEGWVSQFSKTKGKYYYVNLYTKETQWSIPTEPASRIKTKTSTTDKIEVVDSKKCKLKPGNYVKQIKIDQQYLPAWYKNNPQKSDESDEQWSARVQKKIKDWLEIYAVGQISKVRKCTDSWKQNIYQVVFPNMNNKVIYVLENEVIPLTEQEAKTIIAAKKSRVKSIDEQFTHLIVNERILPPK